MWQDDDKNSNSCNPLTCGMHLSTWLKLWIPGDCPPECSAGERYKPPLCLPPKAGPHTELHHHAYQHHMSHCHDVASHSHCDAVTTPTLKAGGQLVVRIYFPFSRIIKTFFFFLTLWDPVFSSWVMLSLHHCKAKLSFKVAGVKFYSRVYRLNWATNNTWVCGTSWPQSHICSVLESIKISSKTRVSNHLKLGAE